MGVRRPRALSLWALFLALAVFGVVYGDDDDAEADDGDLDLEDLDDDSAAPAEEKVEDFDLGMPEEDRKKRMSACYIHMMNRVQHRRTELQQTVEQLMKEHGHREDFTQDKAVNSIAFSWMMSCYMNVDATGMREAILGKAASQELEQELFTPQQDRQQVPTASQRQWELLQQVLADSEKDRQQQQKTQQQQQKSSSGQSGGSTTPPPQQAGYMGGGPLLSGLSGQSQAIYILVVFGAIFGAGILGVMRLMKSEEEGRSSKNKKAEKAEKKNSRKGK